MSSSARGYFQLVCKDPDATLDYKFDWSAWLNSMNDDDQIIDSLWIPVSGITASSATYDNVSATVFISGGADGSQYDIVNRVTTLGGRIDDRTLRVVVTEM